MVLSELLQEIKQEFEKKDIDTAALDARILVMEATGLDRVALTMSPDLEIDDKTQQILKGYVQRRLNYEPVSRILGEREFWGLPFKVTPDTLDPRPDTEILVEIVLKFTENNKDKEWTVIDLGTGSGSIVLSLLHELPNAKGLGVDISDAALAIAKDNAARLGLDGRCDFQGGGWQSLKGSAQKFDIVVCNPPYISEEEFTNLMPDVKLFDPKIALVGADNGLKCYKEVSELLPHLLHEEGFCALEIGFNQAEQVTEIFNTSELSTEGVIPDYAGNDRVVTVRHLKKVNKK